MRVLALCGLIVAVLMFGTCNGPSHPSSETTRSIDQALDRISPPIHQAPNSPGAFVLRDKNVSAFFKDSGVAISVSRTQPAAPDYPADRIQLGVPDRGLLMPSRRPGSVKSLFSPVRYRLGIHWGLVGARAVDPQPGDKQQARINYLVGDRSRWKTDLPGFSRVAYNEVYPGVDLVISSRAHGIKYSLYGKPGSDLSRIPLRYDGVGEIRVVEGGQALEIRTALGVLRESGLMCYQIEPSGVKKAIKARYSSARAGSSAGDWEYEIKLDSYDPRLPTVIDPVIEWSSFLGGGGDPGIQIHGTAVALDSSNNVYLTGITGESDFPTTAGFSPDHRGSDDAYVVKVDSSGSFLVWSSYLGGSKVDEGFSIAVDDGGNAYVCGRTTSTDFPATGSPGPVLQGTADTFAAKINADGSSLAWSFYLGGTQWEVCHSIRVDANRDVYLGGRTVSDDFPIVGGFQPVFGGDQDGFVAKVDKSGSSLLWSSYLGGTGSDSGSRIAIDSSGNVYSTGITMFGDFPVVGGFDNTPDGFTDAFITKVDSTGSAIVYSSYLGGSDSDDGYGIAVDSNGNAIVVGVTVSNDFPTNGGFDTTKGGTADGFVSKVSVDGSALDWSSYLGGSLNDSLARVTVDGSGNVYVSGSTKSADYPSNGGFDTTLGGTDDGIVTKIRSNGNQIMWSSYVGGSGVDYTTGIEVDSAGNVYLLGTTESSDLPVPGGFDTTLNGISDGFVAKVDASGSPLIWSSYLGAGFAFDFDGGEGIAFDGAGNVYVAGLASSGNFPTANGLDDTLGGGRDAFVSKFSADGSILVWSTFLGGSATETGYNVAVDSNQDVYVVGQTNSDDFPIVGGFDATRDGSTDIFIAKIEASGLALVWSSYLGGSGGEDGQALALDSGLNVYVTGNTSSPDFPSSGGFDGALGGASDAIVAKVNADGSSLAWSSYLGGSTSESGFDIAVDGSGNAYIAGITSSNDFPSSGGFDGALGGPTDAFVAKVNAAGSSLAWSSYLGGDTGTESAHGIAVDAAGNVYVAGGTDSTDYTVVGGFQPGLLGTDDAFVAKVDASGASLAWSSYLGGSGTETVWDLAIGPGNNIFLTGYTDSDDFPVPGGFQTSRAGSRDAFVTEVDTSGSALVWSSYLGGASDDEGQTVAVDASGDVYVAGDTESPTFPAFFGIDTTLAGERDVFVVKIDSAGTNTPPVANAGSDFGMPRNIQLYLNGNASFDPDGDPLTYSWLQTGGTPVVLSSNTSPNPDFTVPNVMFDEVMTFQLTVHDGTVASQPDTVDITVFACLDQSNGAPCGDQGATCQQDDSCDGFGTCADGGPELAGTACDDGLFCNGTDQCDGSGGCTVNTGNPCTGGQCNQTCNEGPDNCFDPATTPCDDGTYCNGTDTCDGAGTCVPSGVSPCAGGPQCDNFCNEGPQNCFVAAGTACGSGTDTACDNPDECDGAGACLPMYEGSGFNCDDGTYCNGADTCDGSGICDHAGNPCDGGPPCNNFCNEVPQNCFNALDDPCGNPTPTQCDDADGCDGAGACLPNNVTDGTPCDDLNPCSDLDTCQGGACAAGTVNKDTDTDGYLDDQCPGGDDCDDDLINVNPGASEGPFGDPTCTDTNDNDCDSLFDAADTDCMECTSDPECDDSNECTIDACVASACQNNPVADGTSCNDGVYCTDPDTCTAGVCGGLARDCSSVADQCNDPFCNEGLTQCEPQPKADGTSCDDGVYCSDPDACSGGACVGPARDCSSVTDQCNDPFCNEVGNQCEPQPRADGTNCDDSVYCSNPDTCTGGVCGGPARDCSSVADQCNDPFCNEAGGSCDPQPKADGTNCDDGLYCTIPDTCTTGTCSGSARDCSWAGDWCNNGFCDDGLDQCDATPVADGTGCDDGLYCNNPDTCTGGVCGGPARDCSSVADQCNDPFCNEIGRSCDPQPVPNGTGCDDAVPCTMGEVCTGGVCGGGGPLDVDGDNYVSDTCGGGTDCDDIDPNVNPGAPESPWGGPLCADGIDNNCDGLTDTSGGDPGCQQCAIDPDCDDGNQCNGAETCVGNLCQTGTAPSCDDTNPCTDDTCIPATGCQNTFNTAPCDDGLFCTLNDQCDGAGNCVGTGDPCTTQCLTTCNDTTDSCEPTPDGTACNDGQYCTVSDQCTNGSCTGNTRDCSSFNILCASGDCNEAGDTCFSNPALMEDQPCDDGLFCTNPDTCSGGVCDGPTRNCSAVEDRCNASICNEGSGQCDPDPLQDGTQCEEGDLCTINDACLGGVCIPGPARNCSDANYCTDDGCDPGTGCVYTPNTSPCDDGDLCSLGDNCDGSGNCVGTPIDCSGQVDACNIGTCNSATGRCVREPDPLKENQRCNECRMCHGGACLIEDGMTCEGCYQCLDGSGLRCTYQGDASGGSTCGSGLCVLAGACDTQEHCVIEGFCDVVAAGCGKPAVLYGPAATQTLNCRLGEDKVTMAVKVEPVPGGEGTFVPVRLVLGNADARGWAKGLHELRVVLRLNPERMPGGKIAYVVGSAMLQGGEKYVEEDIDEGNNRAVFRLFKPDDLENVQIMPAPGDGDWALDFVLMRGENAEGVFQVDIWAPCESLGADVGCHYLYESSDTMIQEASVTVHLQRISGSKYVSTTGKVVDLDDADNIGELLKSPVMGCQCGTKDNGGWGWLLLLLLAAVLRKYRS